MLRRVLGCFLVLALYGAASAWLTWPLAALATSYLPWPWGMPVDPILLASVLAHETRALVGNPMALPHAPMFHPEPYALFYGEAGFGALPFFAPVFLATGEPVLALNMTYLAGVTLTATSLHLVIARFTGSWMAGLVGGAMFLTTHWVLWSWLPNAPSYAMLMYLPWIIWLASERRVDRRGLLGLGTLIVLQGLTSVYVAAATILPLACLATLWVVRPASRREGRALLTVLALAVVPLAVAYSGYLIVRSLNPNLAAQSVYGMIRGGRIDLPWGPFRAGQPMALSIVPLLLIVGGGALRLLRPADASSGRDRAWAHGLLWATVGFLASLTPTVLWDGTPISLPHARLARYLGFYDVVRDPARLGIAGLMGLIVLAGAGFAECAARLRALGSGALERAVLSSLVLIGLWGAYDRGVKLPGMRVAPRLPREYPVGQAPITPPLVLHLLSRDEGPVLELPVGPGALNHAVAMYRSIFHGRPVVNGYDGYWPRDFPTRIDLACRLPDADALARLRDETGVRTIVVDVGRSAPMPNVRPYTCPPSGVMKTVWRRVRTSGRADLREIARVGRLWLFSVTEP